jgi:hypothetical protein
MAADIDIDFADRNQILELIKHIPARKIHSGNPERHASGVYVQPIPYDPALGASALHYKDADARGYFKLDLLNVFVYQFIRDEEHYLHLLNTEPPWHRLDDEEFVKQIIHIANYAREIKQCMPDSIPRMAMFLAAIRPSKKHLIGKPWKVMAETIWDKIDGEYSFKKAHGIAYATLVGLHMNIVNES